MLQKDGKSAAGDIIETQAQDFELFQSLNDQGVTDRMQAAGLNEKGEQKEKIKRDTCLPAEIKKRKAGESARKRKELKQRKYFRIEEQE